MGFQISKLNVKEYILPFFPNQPNLLSSKLANMAAEPEDEITTESIDEKDASPEPPAEVEQLVASAEIDKQFTDFRQRKFTITPQRAGPQREVKIETEPEVRKGRVKIHLGKLWFFFGEKKRS